MSTLVGTKGQITIEKEIRDELGVKPGWRALQRRVGDRVEISFLPPRHKESLYGILADPSGPTLATEEEFQQAVEEAWAGQAVEDFLVEEAD